MATVGSSSLLGQLPALQEELSWAEVEGCVLVGETGRVSTLLPSPG